MHRLLSLLAALLIAAPAEGRAQTSTIEEMPLAAPAPGEGEAVPRPRPRPGASRPAGTAPETGTGQGEDRPRFLEAPRPGNRADGDGERAAARPDAEEVPATGTGDTGSRDTGTGDTGTGDMGGDDLLPRAEPLPEEDETGEERPGTRLPGARTPRGSASTAEAGEGEAEGQDGDDGVYDRFLRAPPGTGGGEEREARPIRIGLTETAGLARFRMLDMIAGTSETFEVETGREVTRGRLRIRLASCEVPSSGPQVGDLALVQLWDMGRSSPDPVFEGWMFAESPALSALDHPRYDVWLISCITRSAEASEGNE